MEQNNLFILMLVLAMLWTIPWKGLALWKAARKDDKTWFVILLIVNTLAILEIAYIFLISERKKQTEKTNREY